MSTYTYTYTYTFEGGALTCTLDHQRYEPSTRYDPVARKR